MSGAVPLLPLCVFVACTGIQLLPVLILLSNLRLDLFNCCFLHISFPDENVCVFLVADTWLHSHHLDLIILILDYQLKQTHFAFFVTEPNTLFPSSLPVCRSLRPIKRQKNNGFYIICGGPG